MIDSVPLLPRCFLVQSKDRFSRAKSGIGTRFEHSKTEGLRDTQSADKTKPNMKYGPDSILNLANDNCSQPKDI